MFTLNDAMQLADRATFERGRRYFNAGHVVDVHLADPENDVAQASVNGSESSPYFVSLVRHGKQIEAQCTCPVGVNCKHAVAAILQLAHNRQAAKTPATARKSIRAQAVTTPTQALNQWLSALDIQHAAPEGPLTPSRHYLLYGITLGKLGVEVSFYKGYMKQDFSWSQIKPCPMDFFTLAYNPANHIRYEDFPILNLLATQRKLGNVYLKGEEGALALPRMLDTGRLLLKTSLRLLTPGPAIALDMVWQPTASGSQLQAVLPGQPTWDLIPTDPPFYLAPDAGVVGSIHTHLTGSMLSALRAMPAVPANDMARVALKLRQYFAADQLPLPQEPDIREENTPVPHLTFFGIAASGRVRVPGLRLHWNYGPVAIEPEYFAPPMDEPLIEQDNVYYRIKRDLTLESRAIKQLEASDFILYDEAGEWHNVWMPSGISPQQAMNHWQHWHRNQLPQLQAEGWQISIDPSYRHNVHTVKLDINLSDAQKGWFEFELALRYGQWQLSTMQVVSHWLESGGEDLLFLPNDNGDWLQVDLTPLQPIKAFIEELHSQKKLDKPTRLPSFNALALDNLPDLKDQRAPLTRTLMKELRNFSGLDTITPPPGLNAQLRGYQQLGLNWLAFLHRFNLGGILADDMGLGKTLQTLALILHLKHNGQLKKPALIICPTSLAGNWRREAEHFAPSLRTLVIHGPQRNDLFKQIGKHDLIITTYPLLVRDHIRYQKQTFTLIAADEAQIIKNNATKAAQAIRTLNGQTRLCLTGTPLENHLGELWALMDFVLPGLLHSQDRFRKLFRQPIENDGDQHRRSELARRVAPFMIRRTKAEVVQELPPKTEITQYVELEGAQRQLYESIRVSMEARIRELVKKKGMARSQIEFLDALLKLRQACIDPRLVKLDSAAKVKEQAKLDWLQENLPQMVEEGRRILVFSQFTEALALIEQQVQNAGLTYTKLTGKTRKRDDAIAAFQNGDAAIFLISLKAGGSGLNLTAADVVIHVDPWWNPAVENQATDRAYRIGQDKPVFVYKLVASDTIEERIQDMQKHKQALADALFDETGAAGLPSSADELLALLQ